MSKLFEVRNAKGQYLGTFRAKNAAAAIERLKQADRNVGSAFRKSHRASNFDDAVATEIEPRQ